MSYHNKVRVKILVGKNAGKKTKAVKAKNMNTENGHAYDDPDPVYITKKLNQEGEHVYQYGPDEVEVIG